VEAIEIVIGLLKVVNDVVLANHFYDVDKGVVLLCV